MNHDRWYYLFAGSHEAAQRAAMIYSFFAICKKHEVNPFSVAKTYTAKYHAHKPQKYQGSISPEL